jgi:GT2 family glycosyltransferase/glycosyltransferase involved in cell wall biosynthesis
VQHGVIILGMHRSGTSALAGTLRLRGVEFGSPLMPGHVDDNPRGFFEHLGVVDVHERLLASVGYTWDDPRSLPPERVTGEEAMPFRRELAEILRTTFSGAPLWAVKDPRLCRLLPVWLGLLSDIGSAPHFVVIHRRTAEVAASLARRNGFSPEKAALLWADHVLQTELHTRGHPRVFVSFDRFLSDPEATLDALARMLGLAWPRPWPEAADEVAEFLTPSLRRHLGGSGAGDLDLGRLAPIVSSVEVVLPWSELSDGRELTGPLDDARGELADVMHRLDPLLLQHVAQLGERFHAAHHEATVRAQAQTDQLRRQSHELGQARETVVKLSGELDDWTELAQRQEQELAEVRRSVARLAAEADEQARSTERQEQELGQMREMVVRLVGESGPWGRKRDRLSVAELKRRHRMVGSTWWLARGWSLFCRAVRSPRRARSAVVTRSRAFWRHRIAPRILPGRRPLRTNMRPRPVTQRRLERLQLPSVQRPLASIVIPVFNRVKLTVGCLESIAAAGGESAFEVVLVDDASTDGTAEALEQVPGLRVVRNADNQGFIRSCNRGAREARGRYLLFLNNDTKVTDGWLDRMVRTFSTFSDVGLVGAKLVFPDGTLQEAGGIVWRDGTAWNYGLGLDPETPACCYARDVDYCSGACLMIPRDLFLELGMFDARYAPAYYEDTDLAFRVREAGKRVIYQPAALVYHIEGATSGTSPGSGVKRHQVENQQRFFERWERVLDGHRANGESPELEKERAVTQRMLLIDHRVPTPDKDSGSMRIVNLIRIVQDLGYKVTLLPDNLHATMPYARELQAMGVEVVHRPFERSVKEFLKKSGHLYDLVVLSRLPVAARRMHAVRRLCGNAFIVFDTVDLHFLREMREADLADDGPMREAAAKTREIELAVASAADATFVVSSAEQKLLAEIVPELNVHVVSNVHEVKGCDRPFDERSGLLFIGGFEHPPNGDAVKWFVSEVFPIVRRQLPGVHFYVVGSNPTSDVTALAAEDITVAGWVPDLGPDLASCRISVAPIRVGAGVKGKVNLSLAHGLPCVMTTVAAEGMHLTDGVDAMIADEPQQFADAITRVYTDRQLWCTLSAGGIRNIERYFSFAAARRALQVVLSGSAVEMAGQR